MHLSHRDVENDSQTSLLKADRRRPNDRRSAGRRLQNHPGQQNPDILDRRNQVVLDLLPPQTAPPRPLEPVIVGLEREHGGGQPAQVKPTVLQELQAGLQAGRWKRAKEIQQWLGQCHTKLSVKGVYYWLGKLGGVLKVPRKAHAHKDVAASIAFQQTLCEQFKNLNVAGGSRVRVWVVDEHRYGLIPVVRRCWTLRGIRPTASYQTKYPLGYLYSALEVDGQNSSEFACLPSVSLD